MSVKFEGKPPFDLGIAEVASAHALGAWSCEPQSLSLRCDQNPSPVQFIVTTDVAKALAEQLPTAVRMAELQRQQGG